VIDLSMKKASEYRYLEAFVGSGGGRLKYETASETTQKGIELFSI